ncbi:DNA polymerase III, delta subunit [Altererythrobacter xiamenensis]|uniref:DNA-directed DNA polymerase n=1 Tax=Altererythrobacter xiamenensis TaxID=1316679 RepID=A0A1Y6F7Y8_9SPHN|nr:DNA polymerase III subunit delta [Altererythrobacter xiamenensis]SMQ68822.1 DNA polymerase III, delta subunit [Altererythrobacter xiamenensis]
MKATQRDFRQTAERAAAQCAMFFFCGPDEAGASAAAAQITELLPDAGERFEISGADLRKDPAMLGDEARSNSLFGEKRHIYVRANGDEAHDALKTLIETRDAGAGDAAPVLVVATSATDKSRTAKLLEKRKDALVAMFYPPDLSTVAMSVRQMADAAGLRLSGDLAERIARASGLDVRLAQSEVTKLALYCDASPQAPKPVDPDDLEAIGAATEEDGFMPLVNAVLSGETGKLDREIRRMREHGINPVGLLLAIERRASQLAQITARLGPRGSFDNLGKGEKAQLGIFWREEREIRGQMARWNRRKLERLGPRLMALHRALLANSQAAETLLAQELVEIARFASRR